MTTNWLPILKLLIMRKTFFQNFNELISQTALFLPLFFTLSRRSIKTSSTRIDISDLRLGQSYALENRKTTHWQAYMSPRKPSDNPNPEPINPEMVLNVTKNLSAEL